MRKNIFTIALLLVFTATLIGVPLTAFSANELSFTEDTTISLDSGVSFTVMGGSLADSMTIESSYVTFTLSANSDVVIHSTERRMFAVSGIDATTICNYTGYSQLTLPDQSTTTTATVTPASTFCGTVTGGGGGGGGGGGVSTPSVPTTTTGQVTVTVSGGGKTTLTTADNTTAQVELPANAVSASTEVKIASELKATAVVSRAIPSGKTMVGNYAYNYTATSGTTAVTTFSKNITLTLTYIDAQIAGLNEDTLKVYYWDGTQWSALNSTVDKTNNKITATTNHFTYFVVMGESETPSTMAKPEDYGLQEGDLIRATGDFDIFIINQHGYKRLFLNPAIFNMYGHLGGWEAVKSVESSTRDAFVTSTHYRYVDSPKVYHQEVTGEDTGILHWINMTAENFSAQGGTANAIFTINKSEFDWYTKGTDKTSL
jgi:hypothetical protein